ncbi:MULTISPECIES: NAD(P)/FAD-dependent oxidoreductase [unclassified Bradyrhizobium]|uniref:NAD(P)/FAD-dependent oxidoreductase n=1 Tax=unclassified Bradyrhizobium TaxID=2631580 RepID=UPI001BAD8E22|nr:MULTISPECIES: NAD(P)/FAD-dependent oxidoreductase [unclassified Bradyrhizobium]MBR1206073.1 NAD(P)/FAD-dependent oxidoreductase [Bradyrhizobium sp. AUGA SZCCT0124]MBR1314801.1 NAD(P)/FAD-dependent oxidoreductase [Bradyrhizobium sp. AUGA SZCCT0051]MBR1341772.1 NAD(P)/FAD-dependent oxidoreductase [Bradyrhizobium sp. AUGA SZCCT0105]MBR1358827.1 NAD(P)/FAD-dependent oxidoreductase [Bradyrhizobium sp. AUGA SZCCT0045]
MRLVIIGAGFAGMYAALSAARLRDIHGVSSDTFEIVLVAPEPALVIRPRLYESKPETLTAPLSDVLNAIDVTYMRGSAGTVATKSRTVTIATATGTNELSYDRLVVATGSRLFRPDIPGLSAHGFSVDQLDDAIALDKHLHGLAGRPASSGRDTVVVAGGGFTGIEAATEMPARLRAILGKDAKPRIIIVERNAAVAPNMGSDSRPVIEDALRKLGIETRVATGVASLDEGGVTLSDGERIEAATVVWAAGIRAAPLAAEIPGERDRFGRLLVDRDLRVPGVAGVFATGDAARAACDDAGNYALMSCQHATRMGAFAGHNAAAELLGKPTKPYHQKVYVTCLDLGEAGALFTRGWERKLEIVGDDAKKTKREINTVWIYPPKADRAAALASADPEQVVNL